MDDDEQRDEIEREAGESILRQLLAERDEKEKAMRELLSTAIAEMEKENEEDGDH